MQWDVSLGLFRCEGGGDGHANVLSKKINGARGSLLYILATDQFALFGHKTIANRTRGRIQAKHAGISGCVAVVHELERALYICVSLRQAL